MTDNQTTTTTESFRDLFEGSLPTQTPQDQEMVKGTVLQIGNDYVIVDAGRKSEASIPVEEFRNAQGELEVKPGDIVELAFECGEDLYGYGETPLSRSKAKRSETWKEIAVAYEKQEPILGTVLERVKGGLTVAIQSLRAFLPGSLVDVRPIRDFSFLEGKELEFKIVKMDKKRNNIVVSRRAMIENETPVDREKLLDTLEEGKTVEGVVKNLTDYGAFIDLGGIDGLLHLSDMSWKRLKHPSELINVDEKLSVKVLKFDREKNRVSLGLKQLAEDPWANLATHYPIGSRFVGKVTNLTDYGCFVELSEGVEGLVHMSAMDWTNKNIHPSKVVQPGTEIEVMVLEVDEKRRRISLGIKQCVENPWQAFSENHKKGDVLAGSIKSMTDFGMFVGLEGDIDGLVHMSDISWKEPGEKAIRRYKKGDEVNVIVLAIDPERERISLGVKQLVSDSDELSKQYPVGKAVEATVTEIGDKSLTLTVDGKVTAYLNLNELGDIPPEKDSVVKASVASVDKKQGNLTLTVKSKETKATTPPVEPTTTETLGDLLQEKMRNTKEEDNDNKET